MDNEFKSKSVRIDDPYGSMSFNYELERRVREDNENFIFEAIGPYCSNIANMKISKKDLEEAIQLWSEAKRIIFKGGKP